MGGGGAMRAATRVAAGSYGVNGGIRSAAFHPDQSASAQLGSTQGQLAPVLVCSNSRANKVVAVVDDWEFIEEEDRLVFSGVPSLQEAEEATSDLKHALHKEYFSDSQLAHSVPKPIFRAFSMLTQFPQAQGVVASLASDKNVWDAVMQNEKVMEFIKNQQNSGVSEVDTNIENPFSEGEEYMHELKSSFSSFEEEEEQSSGNNKLMEVMEKVKMRVADMVNSLSGFLQSMFGSPTEEKISIDPNGNATVTAGLGASFMALAVLAIMVAVLKRG